MIEKPLSPKLIRFCCNIIKGMSGQDSAIDAGFASKTARITASKLLTKPNIKAFIASKMQPIQEKAIVDAAYVLKGLKRVHERCLKPEPVMEFDHEEKAMVQKTDEDGNLVYEFDSAGANRALELLGKNLKLFTDKVEHSIDQDSFERLENSRKRASNESK